MQYFEKKIIVDTKGKSDYVATLRAYIPDNTPEVDANRLRPAVLILPGGGYVMTSDREQEPVALKFTSESICVFVLKYSVLPAHFPQGLCEAFTAIKFIRENADNFFIDTRNIAVCGFSAGGHLAASVGVFWNKKIIAEYIGEFGDIIRPDKLVLCYPYINNSREEDRGQLSDYLLYNLNKEEDLLTLTSLDKQVSSDTPPSFIWHTYEDEIVSVRNSLSFTDKLVKNNVPVELHIYRRGEHGLSLGNHTVYKDRTFVDKHDTSDWIQKAIRFIYD